MKPEKRIRNRIAKGIYKDQWGISATVKVGRQQRERRFPATVSLKTIKAWRDETRVALRLAAPKANRGTLTAEATKYLESVSAMPTYAEREAHIKLWMAEFGNRALDTIQQQEIDAVLRRWENEGLAAMTVRNRRTALLHFWNTALRGQRNPVVGSYKPRVPQPEARGIPYVVIERILGAMPDRGQGVAGKARDVASKTKARLAVIAYTGLPHSILKALAPHSVNFDAGTVTVPARKKGAGTKQKTLPLTTKGLEAFRRFDDLDCWGSFSHSSMWKSFRRACDALINAGKLEYPNVRPYDLRHSYGTAAYAATGDIRAVSELMLHSSTAMTMRYSLAAVEPRLKVAASQLDAAFGSGKKRLAVSAGSRKKKRRKLLKTKTRARSSAG